MNFTEIRSSGNRVVRCGLTNKTDTTTLIVVFLNLATARKIFVSPLLFYELNLLMQIKTLFVPNFYASELDRAVELQLFIYVT